MTIESTNVLEIESTKQAILLEGNLLELSKAPKYKNWALIGNGSSNTLIGNDTNNVIDGRGGDDVMIGGRGDDIYHVRDAGDLVEEYAGGGNDIIMSHLEEGFDMRTTAFVEGLQTGGKLAIGNSLNNNILIANKAGVAYGGEGHDVLNAGDGMNALYGEDGNDTMNGGLGADTMEGGIGSDTYFVDSVYDEIAERADEGIDTVNAYIHHVLRSNFENLVLRDSDTSSWKNDINGTGNDLDNKITGNSGKNALAGEGGDDILNGGKGHDVLIGGEGKDAFLFTDLGITHVDRVVDFNAAEDRVLLDNSVFKMIDCGCSTKPASLKEDFFAFGSAKDSNDYIIMGADGGLRYDADGSGTECSSELIAVFRPGLHWAEISNLNIFVV